MAVSNIFLPLCKRPIAAASGLLRICESDDLGPKRPSHEKVFPAETLKDLLVLKELIVKTNKQRKDTVGLKKNRNFLRIQHCWNNVG